MKNLHVLDLSRTNVVSLPPSISELGSLQALILRKCSRLKSVTHVGGLEQLQLLHLSSTGIVELPREIGHLTRLRRLNLSRTFSLIYIPADIIVSLSLLEDLEMWRSSYFVSRNDEREALIENLGHLNQLSHFSASIPDDLCTSSQWKFLQKLKSFILQTQAQSDSRVYLRDPPLKVMLQKKKRTGRFLCIIRDANVSQAAVGLLKYAEILVLDGHEEVMTISAMGAHNLKPLKECWVLRCNKMENIVITEEAEGGILPELQILFLRELRNLSIWEGNGTPGSFRSIKVITLDRCRNMMHLFSFDVLQLLNSLEELKISSCDRMVEVVTGEVGNGVIALPSLRPIILKNLPALNRMWEGVLCLESLRELEVTWCSRLRHLAIDIENTPALQVIRDERKWWDSLEWQN